uniref:non-specific serine/threonine protein kinase n=2 Tax=Trichobilharzia regenti TaxID=157069 RepID=A0AA85JT32_TRIRE|nr:unnamed protein product [Trichobilharzia regenti]
MTDGDVKVFRKRYSVTKKLGKGASGKTYLVEDLQESRAHKKVFKALKCIKLDEIQSLSQNDCEKEARLLSGLRHPYILRTYESFVEKNKFCLVAEYCEGGDLTHYLKGVKENGEHIDEKLVGKWLVQIILATSFIHKNKILHRDLKSSNIFLKNGNIKIGDFGISRLLTTTNELATTFIGTPYYMSPEVLKYEGYNNKSDIWSIGIILYELCTRRRAFTGTNLMRVMWQVINDPCPRLPEIYSKELQEVLQLMLKKVPQERPSASELLKLNIITSYLRELYKEIVFHMQTSPIDESILKKDEIQRFISFEEFINSPDLILQEQELQENDDNLSIKIDYNEENNTENVDDFLTPRQKIKLDRASESDQTIATLRDLAEQLTHSRNTLNSTRRTDLYTWQKRYPSSNRLWPTVQMSTEKMLNELKNLYLEKMNSDYGVTENMDDFENTENLLWPHRPLSENNDSLLGKGPGAEDESLGTFYLTESGKYTNNIQKKTEDSQNPASDSKLKNFCLVPGSTGPMYENRRYEQKKQVVITDDSVDNHDHKDEESNTNQLNLFIRRSFTIPEVSTNNYVQSARQLNTINSCKMKCDDVVSDNTQLMETYYTNYDNDLIEYSITSVHEDLSTPNETGNIAENDLEDIENQDDWNTNETLDDVLSCMKAALCQQEDDQTLVTNDETNCIYGLEAKAKKIETLRNYCVEKLGIQEFHTAYDYLYQKRITENNQSGELTILDGLKNYCSNVTTGFLLDHLIFLENDTKQTISVESPNSLYQILESNLQFCM